MSSSITRVAIGRQLSAMSCESFDIGVLLECGRMLLREGWCPEQVAAAFGWLARENASGAHIFVRPHAEHQLTLLDDLTSSAIAALKHAGFDPAVVIETSPENFQVWLNHGTVLNRELSTFAAKDLARRFGGDPSSADWRHFGRLSGFTNQKRMRRLENGFAPFVRLHEWSGQVYSKAGEFFEQTSAELARLVAERKSHRLTTRAVTSNSIRSIDEYHQDPRYAGDLHRADMAWALHAASHGVSENEIRAQIFNARDLSKKGRRGRQLQYADRTAAKAVASIH